MADQTPGQWNAALRSLTPDKVLHGCGHMLQLSCRGKDRPPGNSVESGSSSFVKVDSMGQAERARPCMGTPVHAGGSRQPLGCQKHCPSAALMSGVKTWRTIYHKSPAHQKPPASIPRAVLPEPVWPSMGFNHDHASVKVKNILHHHEASPRKLRLSRDRVLFLKHLCRRAANPRHRWRTVELPVGGSSRSKE